jgi:release factor glutamine methyltransferase
MYEDFYLALKEFQKEGFDDPLLETLRLFDILNLNTIQGMRLDGPGGVRIDLGKTVSQRKRGIPIEYAISMANFMGRRFKCTIDTLIPTPETALLVMAASESINRRQAERRDQTIIDMGTGCGNIAISIALETEDTVIYASDLSPEAVEVARANVVNYGLEDRIKLRCGDLFGPFIGGGLEGKIDVIVCNPPYMPSESVDRLPSEIRDHEPRLALDAGKYGIDFFVRLLEDALKVLRSKGLLVFEIGEGQENILKRLIRKNGGFEDLEMINYGGAVRALRLVKI